jgi:hypothetical protein
VIDQRGEVILERAIVAAAISGIDVGALDSRRDITVDRRRSCTIESIDAAANVELTVAGDLERDRAERAFHGDERLGCPQSAPSSDRRLL